ncbi:MAG: hypothetical protein ACI39R_04660 [Lachnospiraceae bacterium]
MKKSILVFIMVGILLVGCGKNETKINNQDKSNETQKNIDVETQTQDKAQETSAYDVTNYDSEMISHSLEFELNDLIYDYFFINEEADETVIIDFDGQQYTGTYSSSVYKLHDVNPRNIYKFENGEFDIDSKTGKLVMMCFDADESNNVTYTYEEAEKKAVELAKQYIDIDNYKMEYFTSIYDSSFHKFIWRREFAGVQTDDYFQVTMASDGLFGFVDFSATYMDEVIAKLGKDNVDKIVQNIITEDAGKKAKAKAEALFSDIPGETTIEQIDCKIIWLGEEDFGAIYSYSVVNNNNGEICEEVAEILIK